MHFMFYISSFYFMFMLSWGGTLPAVVLFVSNLNLNFFSLSATFKFFMGVSSAAEHFHFPSNLQLQRDLNLKI